MFTMRRKCDIILIVVIKEVRGYEKPEPTQPSNTAYLTEILVITLL